MERVGGYDCVASRYGCMLQGATAAALTNAIGKIAAQEGLTEKGFRVISNCGEHGCQSVHHLHVHLLGGAQLSEKMA